MGKKGKSVQAKYQATVGRQRMATKTKHYADVTAAKGHGDHNDGIIGTNGHNSHPPFDSKTIHQGRLDGQSDGKIDGDNVGQPGPKGPHINISGF